MESTDFQVGDRVRHVVGGRLGTGTVERVDGRGVRVRFDARSAARLPLRSVFDDIWFQQHPDGLERVANEKRRGGAQGGRGSPPPEPPTTSPRRGTKDKR